MGAGDLSLLIASVVSFQSGRCINLGSGVSKPVHIDQSEYHFGTSLYSLGVDNIRYFFDLIFGKGFIYFSTVYVLFRGRCIR